MPFPIDWNEWHAEWIAWREKQTFKPSSVTFGKKNMLADEVLGIYDVNGQAVELSEVTMPNFGARPERKLRYVGITWRGNHGEFVNGGLVDSFEELNEKLTLGRPE